MVERGVRAAGHRTARYTSPHLDRLEERFVIDGREVSTEVLQRAADTVREATERLLSAGRFEAPPTFFECATAVAFVLFREAGVALAVLEVGLGGRLDATNVVAPIAAAITSIDFDHQAQLGDTLASIAREKAGVIKRGIPVVCGPLPADALEIVRAGLCGDMGAALVMAAPRRCARRRSRRLCRAPISARTPRSPSHSCSVLDSLGVAVDASARRAAIADVAWPGRLEEYPGRRDARAARCRPQSGRRTRAARVSGRDRLDGLRAGVRRDAGQGRGARCSPCWARSAAC